MVIKEEIEKYYEEKLKQTQGRQDVFDRLGARGFRSRVLPLLYAERQETSLHHTAEIEMQMLKKAVENN